MIPVIKMIDPGFHSTVQDAGRRGHQHVGVPVAGALDRNGYLLANALVGNAPGAAALELIGSGPTFEIVAPSVRLVLVGGGGSLDVTGRDGAQIPGGQSVRAQKGETVRVRMGSNAFCSYLAIEGGFQVKSCLDSASTYTRAAFGGVEGRRLMAGDVLHGAGADVPVRPELALGAARDLELDQPIRVVLGPQDDYFTEEAIAAFLSGAYTITPASDRMGFRLAGPVLKHRDGYNIVSDGIVAGSIQVPGSGQPIVLMADAQTTGGYPKIATVISADLPRLGVRGAGRTVRFEAVSRKQAEAIRKEAQQQLQAQIGNLRVVEDGYAINIEALYRDNLIGGVVDAINA